MIKISDLDKRICDVESGDNTQTFREFIIESEEMLEIEKADVDSMTSEELNSHIDWLDDMWEK